MLKCRFWCDQIHNNYCYEFGHTLDLVLKSNLDIQQTEVGLLNILSLELSMSFFDKLSFFYF
jgi:hypothetical protein